MRDFFFSTVFVPAFSSEKFNKFLWYNKIVILKNSLFIFAKLYHIWKFFQSRHNHHWLHQIDPKQFPVGIQKGTPSSSLR